jgi:hypothetical protein
MPLSQPVKYRVRTTEKGKKIRLAFTKGGQVLEAKNLETGATHTEREFRAERTKRGARLKTALMQKA